MKTNNNKCLKFQNVLVASSRFTFRPVAKKKFRNLHVRMVTKNNGRISHGLTNPTRIMIPMFVAVICRFNQIVKCYHPELYLWKIVIQLWHRRMLKEEIHPCNRYPWKSGLKYDLIFSEIYFRVDTFEKFHHILKLYRSTWILLINNNNGHKKKSLL